MIIPWHLYEIINEERLKKEERMLNLSNLEKNYITNNLRFQVCELQYILENLDTVEDSNECEYEYVAEGIKKIESDLKRVRTFLDK